MMEVNGREEVVVPAEDELVKGSRVGRVVPFFPTDWNKSSNNMFNQDQLILEYQKGQKIEAMQEIIDYENFNDDRFGELRKIQAMGGARPTSGKHYSRHFDSESVSQYLHKATQPPVSMQKAMTFQKPPSNEDDDARSHIAKMFDDTRKVEDLLKKLDQYTKGKLVSIDDSVSFPLLQPSTAVDTNSIGDTNYNAVIPELDDGDEDDLNQMSRAFKKINRPIQNEDQFQVPQEDKNSQQNESPNKRIKHSHEKSDQSQKNIIPWNYNNSLGKERPKFVRSVSPQKLSVGSEDGIKLKKYVDRNSDSEVEVCSDVGHRFHSHSKVESYPQKMVILNHSKKIHVHGLPDMEFALTPVPGAVTKPGNIYQTTKLLTDADYMDKLKQFEKNTKNGVLKRKGRLVSGMFSDANHLNYEHDDGNMYSILNNHYGAGVDAKFDNRMDRNNSVQIMKHQKFTLVASDHIPYDPYHVELMKKIKQQQLQQLNRVHSQEVIGKKIQVLNDTKQVDRPDSNISIIDGQGKLVKTSRVLKLIQTKRELVNMKNHQAFWVHNTKKPDERDRLQQLTQNRAESQLLKKPDDYFANPNAKMVHVKSYMMVNGKLIPSIKYKAKQKIYNRYKIEDETIIKGKGQELITFPDIAGPLKLPNIGFSNDVTQQTLKETKIESRAEITMEVPQGKRNLQSYIQVLQTKQNRVDSIVKEQVAERRDHFNVKRALEEEDPRDMLDLQEENRDLQEQYMFQLRNMASYANVAHLWWQENRGDGINPYETFTGSFQGVDGSENGEIDSPPVEETYEHEGHISSKVVKGAFKDYPSEVRSAVQNNYKVEKGGSSVKETMYQTGASPSLRHNQSELNLSMSLHSQLNSERKGTNRNQRKEKFISQIPETKSHNAEIKNTIMQKVAFVNKKIKSIFFGANAMNEDQKPEVEVEADYQIPQIKQEEVLSQSLKPGKSLQINIHDRPKLQAMVKAGQFGFKIKLTLEIEKMREQLQYQYRNLRVIDLENKIRDNKRQIVNLLSENIYGLRFGQNAKSNQQLSESDLLLSQVLDKRQQAIKVIKFLHAKALERSTLLSEWLVHSTIISTTKKIKILSDIVVLCQEKNLLDEFFGIPVFKQVGIIEAELGFPLRIAEKYGSMEDNDYFTRRMRIQFDEYLACLNLVEFDLTTHEEMRSSMVDFISEMLGHTAWVQVAMQRNLRRQQLRQEREFDPAPENIMPVVQSNFTTLAQTVLEQSTASKQIESFLPISGTDQFGSLEKFVPPQLASRPIQQQLKLNAKIGRLGIINKIYPTTLALPNKKQEHYKKLIQQYWTRDKRKQSLGQESNESDGQNNRGINRRNQSYEDTGVQSGRKRDKNVLDFNELSDDGSIDRYDNKKNIITNYALKHKLEEEEKQREQERLLKDIQDQLDRDKEEKKGDDKSQPRKSKWIDVINKEKLEKDNRQKQAKREQEEKLRKLLGEDNNDYLFDASKYQKLAGGDLFDYLRKINDHVQTESNLLVAWQGNDLDQLNSSEIGQNLQPPKMIIVPENQFNNPK